MTPRAAATVVATSVRVGQGRQIDPDHAVGEVRGHVLGDGQGEARLAHATGTGQRQQRNGILEQEARGPRRRSASRPMRRVLVGRQACNRRAVSRQRQTSGDLATGQRGGMLA